MQNSFRKSMLINLSLLVSLFYGQYAFAEEVKVKKDIKSEFIYRSPEERREAGLKTELTDWLTFSGLVEIERVNEKSIYVSDIPDIEIDDDTEVLQLGFEIEFTDNIQAVFVYEFERDELDNTNSMIEEVVLIIEIDNFEIEAGRQTVPFGEYYSHFITDPSLSFGEKLDDNIVLTYEASDYVDIAIFVSEGNASKAGEKTRDWGLNLELRNEEESIKVSVGYLSDLADTDEQLLFDFNNIYQERVPAWNMNALLGFDNFEITAEIVEALDSFVELDRTIDRPSAFNIELAYFPIPEIQIAIRSETSKELEDAPEKQYGISTTVVFARSMTVSVEYLTGSYKDNFVFDDDSPFDKIETFAFQFAFAF